MGCSDAHQTTTHRTDRVSNVKFFYSSRMKTNRVLITVARARNGNVRRQRGGEPVLGDKRWIIERFLVGNAYKTDTY